MVIQQQRAKQQELETARLASLAETTKENEIEGDDNMERPTNRQRLYVKHQQLIPTKDQSSAVEQHS